MQKGAHLILIAEQDVREASRLIGIVRDTRPDCEIKHLRNGIELSEFFQDADLSAVCMVLLNIALPKCQICELIRNGRSALKPDVPVIGYSFHLVEISHQTIKEAGISSILQAPLQPESLLSLLRTKCDPVK